MNAAVMQILIEAKNQASKELNFLGDQVTGLSKGFGVMTKGAIAAGVALAAIEAGKIAYDMGRATAGSLRLASAFDTLASQASTTGQAMLASMRQAAQGTIDDTSLIASANKAMLLEVAKGSEDMAKLLEIAAARGKATGRSATEALEDIVTGIGRLSPMILDNLGIVVDQEKAYTSYARTLGIVVDQMSEAQKKAALLNAAYAASEDLIRANKEQGADLASSFERMDASLANAKDALGVLFTPYAAKFAAELANAVDGATEKLLAMGEAQKSQAFVDYQRATRDIEGYSRALAELEQGSIAVRMLTGSTRLQMEAALGAAQAEQQRAWAQLQSSDTARQAAMYMRDLAITSNDSGAASAAAGQQEAIRTRILAGLADELERVNQVQSLAAGAASAIASSYKGVISQLGLEGAFEGYETANAQLQKQIKLWEQMGLPAERIDFLISQQVETINNANRALTQTKTGLSDAEKAAQKLASETERAFESLKSKVAGVLQGALDPGVGVDPADFLPREDAINEDARRLADVAVNGFQSPWAGYLQNKFPELFSQAFDASGGDVQQAAARILRDFQDGLNPELIDKAAAKERIKRMLLGEATMAEIAQEIAQELSQEMGGRFTPGQIQAAAGEVLGLPSGQTGGDQFSNAFAASIENSDAGSRAIDGLTRQLVAGFEVLEASGRNAGQAWGNGFMTSVQDGIPPRLVAALTDIITPEVYARLRAQGSLTGAVN